MLRLVPLLLVLGLLAAVPASVDAQERQTRVTNGQDAADGEYPWTVALVDNGGSALTQFCGGTLLSPTVVVTASHCIVQEKTRLEPDELDVYAGTDRSLRTAARTNGGFHDVAAIALHPQIDEREGRFDLALLRLATPVPDPKPAKLPDATAARDVEPAAGSTVRIEGWGRDPFGDQEFPDELQWGDLEVTSDADCTAAWDEIDVEIFEDTFCALGSQPDEADITDSCNGDSGGPITNIGADPKIHTDWIVYGAVSFGSESCTTKELPGVYVRFALPSIHTFLSSAFDADPSNDPAPLPWFRSGTPTIDDTTPTVGETITCSAGSLDVEPDTAPITLELRRTGGTLGQGAGAVSHRVVTGDIGSTFSCVGRSSAPGFVSYAAVSQAASTSPVPAPPVPPAPAPEPPPAPPVLVPPPPVVLPPADTVAPRVDGFSRSCTRRRRCSLSLRVVDPAPSYGVHAPTVTLTSTVRRSCVRDGRRRTCTRRTTKTLQTRRLAATTTYLLDTGTLRRGRHTLRATVSDLSGNARRIPFTASFTLR